MTGTRFGSLALAIGSLVVFSAGAARGQGNVDLKPYRMDAPPLPGDALSKMLDLRTGKMRTEGPGLNANQVLFRLVAKAYVNKATYEQYYTIDDKSLLMPRTGDQNFDSLLSDFSQLILTPAADTRPPLTPDQADYIKHFGVALDEAFRQVWAKNPPPVIRVNSGRMFALAARSGAPAFGKTVTELLKNQFFKGKDPKASETPADLLLYALKAAEGLLGAYDPLAIPPRDPNKHTLPEPELVALVQVLCDLVEKGPPVADKAAVLNPDQPMKSLAIEDETKAPKAKDPAAPKAPTNTLEPKGLTPEQIALVQYYRRQAVRALAKVRYDSIGGEAGTPRVRPAFTLAKVAVADASISPLPTATEVAEAVIGLCGVNPTRDLKIDELGVAIATGVSLLVRFNSVDRARLLDNADAKLYVPWKLYAARMAAAFGGLKRGTQTNGRLRSSTALVNALSDAVMVDVLVPFDGANATGTTQPNLDRVSRWLEQYQPKSGSRSLFEDDPKFKLNPAQLGN